MHLPDWLRLWFQSALISEIYPEIRAIAVGYSPSLKLTVRYYLDREPVDFDYESLSNTMGENEILEVSEECLHSEQSMSDLDRLDGLVYARREYVI